MGTHAIVVLLTAALIAGSPGPDVQEIGVPRTTNAPEPEPIAFLNVTVLPMTGDEPLLADHTVLVRGGRVRRVGPSSDVEVPADARRIGGEGLYLLPGLVDMHVHLDRFPGPAVLKLFLANGVTTVRNMDGRPRILEYRQAVKSGTLAGPHIYTAGQILEGEASFWEDTGTISSPTEARLAVDEQAAAGYDFVKIYHTLAADVFRAVVDQAGRRDLVVSGHVPKEVGLDGMLEAAVASIEHFQGYDEAIEAADSPYRGHFHWSKLYLAMPADTERIWRAASRTTAAGVWNCPTLVQQEKIAPYEEMEHWFRSAPLDHLPQDVAARWNPKNLPGRMKEQLQAMDEDDRRMVARGEKNRGRLLRALHEEGGGLLVGTDTPQPFVPPGTSVHEEIENFTDAGLSRHEALRAATAAPGRFARTELGETRSFGVIEPGARADLLLLSGNPLESLEHLSRIRTVTVAGRLYGHDRIRGLRKDVAERYGH